MKQGVSRTKKPWFDKVAIMFIAPAFIFYTLFIIWPTISSVYYSFTSWDGISSKINFIGLGNYKEIFTSARFGNALKNTIILTVFISIFENAFAMVQESFSKCILYSSADFGDCVWFYLENHVQLQFWSHQFHAHSNRNGRFEAGLAGKHISYPDYGWRCAGVEGRGILYDYLFSVPAERFHRHY